MPVVNPSSAWERIWTPVSVHVLEPHVLADSSKEMVVCFYFGKPFQISYWWMYTFSGFFCIKKISCGFFMILCVKHIETGTKHSVLSASTRWQWEEENEDYFSYWSKAFPVSAATWPKRKDLRWLSYLLSPPRFAYSLTVGFWCCNNVLWQISF